MNQENNSEELLEQAQQEGIERKEEVSNNELLKKATNKVAKKATSKAGLETAKKQLASKAISLLGPLLPYIAIAVLIILALIMIIGILAFFLTMPGLMQDKISSIFEDISVSMQCLYKSDVDAKVTNEDVIELANYINNMEYDLIGYGFVKPDRDINVKTIEQLQDEGYHFIEEKNPDKDKDGEPKDLIFLVDENGNKYDKEFYYTDGKKYGTDGKPYKDGDGNYTRYEIGYNSNNEVVSLPEDPSSVLRTYAMSERRLYVLRNDDQGFLERVFTFLNEVLNGYSGAWAQGLIELFPAVNGRADEGRYNLWDSITDVSKVEITGDNKLSVKVGWLNEPMKFELDGWTGRYGMSTDFLISLHLATLSPDLVTTLVQTYDTRVQVYLDHIEEATVTAYFRSNDGNQDIFTPRESLLEKRQDSGWNYFDSWFLSKKEAKEIMKAFNIKSLTSGKYTCGGEDPSQVLYYSGKGSERVNGECFTKTFDDIDWYDNVFKDQYFLDDNSFSDWEEALNIEVINTDKGETAKNTDKDKYVTVTKSSTITKSEETAEDANDNNESQEEAENNGTSSQNSVSVSMHSNNNDFRPTKLGNVLGMLNKYYQAINTSTDLNIVEFNQEQDCQFNFCTIFDPESKYYFENYLSYNQLKTMAKDSDQYYECEIAVWKTNDSGLKEGDNGYKPEEDGEIVLSLLVRRTNTDENFDLAAIAYRNYSNSEMEEKGFNPNKPNGVTPCSETDSDAVCSNCRRYIADIISALGKIEDDSYETYEPYIARVVGSWFRDVYMIVPESDDDATNIVYDEYEDYEDGSLTMGNVEVINNDLGFLEGTGELWTKYLYDDKELDYALFVINPDGSYLSSDNDITEWKKYYPDLPEEIYNSIGVLEKDGINYYGYIYVYPDTNPTASVSSKTDVEMLFMENNVSFIKRAETSKLTSGGTAVSNNGWSAYSYSENWSDEKVPIEVVDAPKKIQQIHEAYNAAKEGGEEEYVFYYSMSAKNVVTQVEDGQRGITNEKIKYLFKNKKYYKYDGTVETAYAIKDDWNECIKIFQDSSVMKSNNIKTLLKEYARGAIKTALFGWGGLYDQYSKMQDTYSSAQESVVEGYIDSVYYSTISENFKNNFKFARDFDGDGKADLVSKNLENKLNVGEYYEDEDNGISLLITEGTVFDYDPRNPDLINKIDLTTESLAAFSILENTHTADADYAYRDLKELMCELDYFDKEDLTEPAKDVLEWPLPASGSAGWPIRKYDKLDEYGSLIHSKEMYDNLDSIMANVETTETIDTIKNLIQGYEEVLATYDESINNAKNENKIASQVEAMMLKNNCYETIIEKLERVIDSNLVEASEVTEYKNKLEKYNTESEELKTQIEELNKQIPEDSEAENKTETHQVSNLEKRVASRANSTSNVSYEYKKVTDPNMHCEATLTVNGIEYRGYKQAYPEWGYKDFSEDGMARSCLWSNIMCNCFIWVWKRINTMGYSFMDDRPC